MRWVALLMVSSLPLAACGGGEFTSAGAGGTSSGGAAGASGVGGSPDGGFGGTGVAGSAGQVGTGGAGGAGGSSGAGGVVNSDCAFPAGLSVPSNPTYHSTLDSREAVRSPAIGVGEGSVISTDPTDDFIGSRCDFGVQINGQGEFFSIPEAGEEHVNIDYRRGTLMFYLTPYFDSSDNASHILFQTAGDQSGGGFTLEKAASNDLRFIAQASGAAGLTFQRYVRGADYSFNANDPIHIAVSWNLTVVGGGTVNVGIYLNGEALPLTGALSGLNMRNGNPNASLRFANNDAGDALATGLFDDIWIFHDVIE